LLALVPRPRRHLVTYHGVLAPAAGLRSRVVPRVEAEEERPGGGPAGDGVLADEVVAAEATCRLLPERGRRWVPHAPGKRRRCDRSGERRRYPWAELLRRVFEVEALVCPHCGGARRLLAAITAPESIERVLLAMGLPHEAPVVAPARAPPEETWWGT